MSTFHFTAAETATCNVLFVREGRGRYRSARPDEVVSEAQRVLAGRLQRGIALDSPNVLKDYMKLQIGTLPHEVFVVAFADAQHQLIAIKEMFRGTLTQTSVYPREVVKEALALNAAAVFLAHNHPSGVCEPSRADELLTKVLQQSLALVDVRVVDHLVVSATSAVSFAERGLI